MERGLYSQLIHLCMVSLILPHHVEQNLDPFQRWSDLYDFCPGDHQFKWRGFPMDVTGALVFIRFFETGIFNKPIV